MTAPPDRRRGRGLRALPRRFVAGVLIGVGTIFGSKAERDQHWSIPPTMVSDAVGGGIGADGDDDLAGDEGADAALPACA